MKDMKKADHVNRALAKIIDFLVAALAYTLAGWVGILVAGVYLLLADAFFQGQSLGKKLIGLRVVVPAGSGVESHPCAYRESMIRNGAFAFIIVVGSIPFLGYFVVAPLGVVFVIVEAYFVYSDDEGVRIGDIFAGTRVLDIPRSP